MVFSAVICLSVNPVYAAIPTVTNLQYSTSGTETILTINIQHGTGGTGMVDVIQVDIDGAINVIEGVNDPGSETFSIDYNMGVVTGTTIVRARAECSMSGYGEWCNPITVPEFPLSHLILFFLIISIAVMLLRLKIYQHNKTIK